MLENKKIIRLTEGDLHRIIKSAVNKVLSEGSHGYYSAKNRVKAAPSDIPGYPWHDWRDAYQKYRDFKENGGCMENPKMCDELEKEWIRQLKAECTDDSPAGYSKLKYRQKLFNHMHYYDVKAGKTGEYWDKDYYKDMGEE